MQQYTFTIEREQSDFASQIETLATIGTRAISVTLQREMHVGKTPWGTKGDFKLNTPSEFFGMVKTWKMTGLVNVDYTAAVNRHLSKIGHSDAGTWEGSGSWGTRQGGTRANIGHKLQSYLQLFRWYGERNLFTRYSVDNVQIDPESFSEHLYAKGSSSPSIRTSDGERVPVPFYVSRVKFEDILELEGLPKIQSEPRERMLAEYRLSDL
tara:strand:+ start:1184 stop:1813 length:630 start_codon:yes stop_codon:yes gene_type:complete